MARALAEEQTKPGTTKGRIVGQLLDTHAALKGKSSQGQSFYAFWNLLSSPERQERWRELIRHVYRLETISADLRTNQLLERLSSRLLVEGERVVRSNERMAATLRRALESAATGEDRRLRELIREIQQLALACRPTPPDENDFSNWSGIQTCSPLLAERSGSPRAAGRSDGDPIFAEHTLDMNMLERFRALVDLNLTRLRDHVRACLLSTESVLLSQVLERFPPHEGILEIVGYLVVATQDAHNYVPGDQFTDVQFSSRDGRRESWRVPGSAGYPSCLALDGSRLPSNARLSSRASCSNRSTERMALCGSCFGRNATSSDTISGRLAKRS